VKKNKTDKDTLQVKPRKKKYERYTEKHLRHRNMRFWLIYLGLLVLIAVCFTSVYAYFDKNLREYEAAQYIYLAEDVSRIFTERRFDELYTYEDTGVEYLETREDYVNYLNTLTEGKTIAYSQVSSTDYNEVKFVVTADGASFARFTLRKTGEVQSFEIIPLIGYSIGTDLYELGEITTDIIQPITYDYTIPASATITVNGKSLPESTVVKSGETLFYEGHLPAGYPSETLTSYRFTCAMGTPEIVVTDADGNALELTEVGQDSYRYEFQYCDAEMKKAYEEYGVAFVKLLCRYSTDNCKLSTLLAKVKSNSAAYDTIQAIDEKWRTKADDYTFLNIETCNYARFSDTVYCCDVSLNYHGTFKGKVNDYPTKVRVYLIKDKGEWKVYDFMYLS